MSKFSTRFLVMAVVFAVCLITSNFFVPRLWQLAGVDLQLSAAVLLFPVSYILNDCFTEVYGYRKARFAIWLAFGLQAFVALMSALACSLPMPIEESAVPVAEHFNGLFMMVPQITVASLLAFICGSMFNSFIISRMKTLSRGKAFGIRAIISSIGGEMLDSFIFFPLAYWGVMDLKAIISLAVMEVVVKVLYEVIALPLTSTFVRYIKRKEGLDTFDEGISYNPFRLGDM